MARDDSSKKRASGRRKLLVTGALSTGTLLGGCGSDQQVLSNPKGSLYDEDAGATAPATDDAGGPTTGDQDAGGVAQPQPGPKK